jgi:hypothetical protein
MVRLVWVVVPGIPHHIAQRGNRRKETFFCPEDYAAYLALMGEWCRAWAVELWADVFSGGRSTKKSRTGTARNGPGGPWGATASPGN